jgi:hypothetical protein
MEFPYLDQIGDFSHQESGFNIINKHSKNNWVITNPILILTNEGYRKITYKITYNNNAFYNSIRVTDCRGYKCRQDYEPSIANWCTQCHGIPRDEVLGANSFLMNHIDIIKILMNLNMSFCDISHDFILSVDEVSQMLIDSNF